MDMRLGIEPLRVIEQRHILEAVRRGNGRVDYAAELLEVGRSTIYKKLASWDGVELKALAPARDYPELLGKHNGPLRRRRFVESVIEQHGGNLTEAAAAINYTLNRLNYSMGVWHRDDEIEVMQRRRSVEEHAKRIGLSIPTAYKLIDEACALVGLRRYRHWLFLRPEA